MKVVKVILSGFAWAVGLTIVIFVLMIALNILEYLTCGIVPIYGCVNQCTRSVVSKIDSNTRYDEDFILLFSLIAGFIIGVISKIAEQIQEEKKIEMRIGLENATPQQQYKYALMCNGAEKKSWLHEAAAKGYIPAKDELKRIYDYELEKANKYMENSSLMVHMNTLDSIRDNTPSESCLTCIHRDDTYGDCPYEPNRRSERIPCNRHREN